MARTHRAHRKGSRKATRKGSKSHRKAHRKSHRKTHRRMRGGSGIFSKLWSPFHHASLAAGEAVGAVTDTTRKVAKTTLRGVDRIGSSVTGHANAAIRGVFSRKRRGGRR